MSAPSSDASALEPAPDPCADPGDTGELAAVSDPPDASGPPVDGADPTDGADRVDGAGPTDGAESELDRAPADLASAIAERDAYLDDLRRVTAEFTNFRRQTMKRNTELVAQAASRLARELLPVLDACEAAVSQGVEGIEALQSQLLGVLTGEGLAVLGTVDEPFDPGFHEAVMSEASTGDAQDAPVVSEVLRTGYAWNGRVLRPAMVKVRS